MYEKLTSQGNSSAYSSYITSIDKTYVERFAQELNITLPKYSFIPLNNGKDNNSKSNGKYTISVK